MPRGTSTVQSQPNSGIVTTDTSQPQFNGPVDINMIRVMPRDDGHLGRIINSVLPSAFSQNASNSQSLAHISSALQSLSPGCRDGTPIRIPTSESQARLDYRSLNLEDKENYLAITLAEVLRHELAESSSDPRLLQGIEVGWGLACFGRISIGPADRFEIFSRIKIFMENIETVAHKEAQVEFSLTLSKLGPDSYTAEATARALDQYINGSFYIFGGDGAKKRAYVSAAIIKSYALYATIVYKCGNGILHQKSGGALLFCAKAIATYLIRWRELTGVKSHMGIQDAHGWHTENIQRLRNRDWDRIYEKVSPLIVERPKKGDDADRASISSD